MKGTMFIHGVFYRMAAIKKCVQADTGSDLKIACLGSCCLWTVRKHTGDWQYMRMTLWHNRQFPEFMQLLVLNNEKLIQMAEPTEPEEKF